jgi:hypothetical protein
MNDLPMPESITVTSAHTEELDAETRAAIIHVCQTAHQEDDFQHLFPTSPPAASMYSPTAKRSWSVTRW